MKTTRQQLEEVQAAITAVMVAGQSYTLDGRTFTRADLGALTAREKELKVQFAREIGARPSAFSVDLAGSGY